MAGRSRARLASIMISQIPSAQAKPPGQPHWIVTSNYRLRAFSLGLAFVALAIELWGRASAAAWAALVLIFLVYPHLAYLRARHSADSRRAEYLNLVIDAFMIGAVLAALRFPLWLTFTLSLGTAMNSAICLGVRGLAKAVVALLAGALGGVAVFGFGFAPDTRWPTTVLTIAGMSAYMLAISLATFWHNVQLRSARHKLRSGEQELSESNERLQQKLVEITRLQAQLNEQALRDPLTGLFNRRYLETIVPHELTRCARDGSSLALMMIDIDHFKSVNDRFGHQGGDEVLKALAALLTETVRASDVACRFGGEEFLLLLPSIAAHNAMERADQWRERFAQLEVHSNGAVIHSTLSIGVAMHPEDGADLHSLVQAADRALYQAKAEGRNRVVAAGAALREML